MLAVGWQTCAAANVSLRTLELSEFNRTYDAELAAGLDAGPDIASRAALALGRTKRPEALAPLRAHLGVHDPGERALVVYALGLLADGASADAIRRLARSDSNSAVRYAAVDALGRIVLSDLRFGTRGTALDLLIVARSDRNATVRAHTLAQLDAFAKAAFAPELAGALERVETSERDPAVRWHVAWSLFRGYAKLADAAFLRRSLGDRDELVRVEALRAWGRRSDPGAAALVRPLLRDPSWRVQFEAREALRRLAKLPPTEHLSADPPGLHLPRIPALPTLPAASASPPAPPQAAPGAGAASRNVAAPDPAAFDLPPFRAPRSAEEMNGLAATSHPRVRIRTTKGDVVVALFPEWAPSTVANFLALAQRGYYDGNRWFRIVPDFVVQTGDPTDNGEGDAGYSIPAEENPLEQRSGIIAMGLNYEDGHALRDSAGTQFYLTLSPQLHLDRDFSVFGEVVSGFDVLANLVESDRMVSVRRIADR